MAKKKTNKKNSASKTTKKSSGGRSAASKKTAKKTAKKTTKKTTKPVAKKVAKTVTKKVAKKTTKKATTAALKKAAAVGNARSVAAVAVAAQPDAAGYVVINGRRVRMISTKGLTTTKKKTSTARKTEVETEARTTQKVKTKLARKDLENYRALLLRERARLLGLLDGMEHEALRSKDGNLSNMPLHMADVGTDTFDKDLALGMAETERKLLKEIHSALIRVNDKTYGMCEMTGKQIPKARLEAKPWARYTIESARKVERGLSD